VSRKFFNKIQKMLCFFCGLGFGGMLIQYTVVLDRDITIYAQVVFETAKVFRGDVSFMAGYEK
jgi:hypothetical protein